MEAEDYKTMSKTETYQGVCITRNLKHPEKLFLIGIESGDCILYETQQ